jgi:hypothetical protein
MRKARLYASIAASIAAFAAAASTAGCSESTDPDLTSSVATTAVSVSPSLFLGDVPCSTQGGALQSYVVTLTDITTPGSPATLPSSPPTPCSRDTLFRYIAPARKYIAEIDGYDVLAGALKPLGGAGSGGRHMLLEGADTAVLPRFTTSCAEEVAALQKNVQFDACEPLVDHQGAGPTSIKLDPGTSLGGLTCAAKGGSVVSFDITPVGSPLPALLGLACGSAPVVFDAGVEAGQVYTFRLEARAAAGGDVVWGASCFALPEAGLVTGASCDPLSSSGAIEVSPAAVLEAGVACEAGMPASYEASIEALSLSSGPVPCGESARFVAIKPGTYGVTLRAGDKSGAEAACEAKVAPGDTAPVTCAPAP